MTRELVSHGSSGPRLHVCLVYERDAPWNFYLVSAGNLSPAADSGVVPEDAWRAAWEAVQKEHSEIGGYPPEPGDEWDMLDLSERAVIMPA